jgi:hypothetical protein
MMTNAVYDDMYDNWDNGIWLNAANIGIHW